MRSVAGLGVLIVALLGSAVTSAAAQTERKPSAVPSSTASSAGATTDAAPELPVSIERIRRKLAQARPVKRDGLRLQYYVEVYGKSPRIDLFADFDPVVGPVQYGSPTHGEFLQLVTPQEFRAPAGDLLSPAIALMKWLGERGKNGKKTPDPR